MLKKISTFQLLLIFIVLIGLLFLVFYKTSDEQLTTFSRELVEIDTSKVTMLHIYPKALEGANVKMKKENGNWMVEIPLHNKWVPAVNAAVQRALGDLANIKSVRLAGTSPEKWGDFQVDSTGVRVEAFEEGKKTLDLVLGRFSFKSKNEYYTYVRKYNQNKVHTTFGFLQNTFDKDEHAWRNSNILTVIPDSIKAISYTYPGDSSFVLSKSDSVWSVGGVLSDSAKTQEFLNGLRNISHTNFADDLNSDSLANISPTLTVSIMDNNANPVEVWAYADPNHTWLIRSSANGGNVFASSEFGPFQKIFISGRSLFTEE